MEDNEQYDFDAALEAIHAQYEPKPEPTGSGTSETARALSEDGTFQFLAQSQADDLKRKNDEAIAKSGRSEAMGSLENIKNAAKRGMIGLSQGGDVSKARGINSEIKRIDDADARVAELASRLDQPNLSELISGNDENEANPYLFLTPAERNAARIQLEQTRNPNLLAAARKQVEREGIPTMPEVEDIRRANIWENFGDWWDKFKKAPLDYIATISAESLVQSAPSLAMGIGGSMIGGIPGGMAGMGAGSFQTDYLSQVLGALAQEGVDVRDVAALEKAFSDKDLMQRVEQRSALHAAPVAALDALSMGVASKLLVPKALLASRPVVGHTVNVAAQMPVQGTLGAAGEIAGSVASGQKINPSDVAAEFFGEFGMAPLEVAGIRGAAQQQDAINKASKAKADADAATGATKTAPSAATPATPTSSKPKSVTQAIIDSGPVEGQGTADEASAAQPQTIDETAASALASPEGGVSLEDGERDVLAKALVGLDAETATQVASEAQRPGKTLEALTKASAVLDETGDATQAVASFRESLGLASSEIQGQENANVPEQTNKAAVTPQSGAVNPDVTAQAAPAEAPFTERSGQTSLVPEVTDRERVALEASRPLRGGDKPMDDGLFGSSSQQTDLMDAIAKSVPESAPAPVRQAQTSARRSIVRESKPVSLLSFLRSRGGIKDEGGDLKSMGALRQRPGLMNNKSGMTLDRARELAVEAGYLNDDGLTSGGLPTSTVAELLDAIGEELSGRSVYSAAVQGDVDAGAEAQQADTRRDSYIDAISTWFEEVGLPFDLTDTEIDGVIEGIDSGLDIDNSVDAVLMRSAKEIEDAQRPGSRDSSQALQGVGRTGPVTNGKGKVRDTGPGARGNGQAGQAEDLVPGFDLPSLIEEADGIISAAVRAVAPPLEDVDGLPQGVRDYLLGQGSLSRAAIQSLAKTLGVSTPEMDVILNQAISTGWLRKDKRGVYRRGPKSVEAKGAPEPQVARKARRKAEVNAAVEQAVQEMAQVFPNGTNITVIDGPSDLPSNLQNTMVQAMDETGKRIDALTDQDGNIYIASYALDLNGLLAHEGVHAVVRKGLMTAAELKILAKRAAKLPNIFNRAKYQKAYAQRYDANGLEQALDEEAAAHLIQARANGMTTGKRSDGIIDRLLSFFERLGNKLNGLGFRSADDVEAAFFSGDIAQRQADDQASEDAAAMYALSDAETGQSMRADLDSLGYYSKALEVAKTRIQAKGTPEQMLAAMRNAGVKQNEIEATGLDKFLEGKSGSRGTNGTAGSGAVTVPNAEAALDAYVKRFNADIEENGRRYFDDWTEDPNDPITADDWGRQTGGREISEQADNARPYGESAFKVIPATAVALESAAEKLGIQLSLVQSVTSASRYGTMKVGGREYKVRLADHERQSGLHESADFNIAPSSLTPEQFITEMARMAPSNGDRSAGQSGSAGRLKQPSITRNEIVKYLEENRIKINEVNYGAIPETAMEEAFLTAADELEFAGADRGKVNRFLGELQSYGRWEAPSFEMEARKFLPEDVVQQGIEIAQRLFNLEKETRYSQYSLDRDNPTYRETVLHLHASKGDGYKVVPHPEGDYRGFAIQRPDGSYVTTGQGSTNVAAWSNRAGAQMTVDGQFGSLSTLQDFRSGHFSEPNIIGHMMTSMTEHQGKSVFTVDQIQSDWGQKLRDGGVRDEAKIANLRAALSRVPIKERPYFVYENGLMDSEALKKKYINPFVDGWFKGGLDSDEAGALAKVLVRSDGPGGLDGGFEEVAGKGFPANVRSIRSKIETMPNLKKALAEFDAIVRPYYAARHEQKLLEAELRTAETSATGNPLVNTTDQWTNTVLRRAIRQAAESGADAIAIPSGKTVLSYNPGNEHGMEEFYDKIVPKNLKNLLAKLDPKTPAPVRIETLDSPSGKTGLGKGFSLHVLTDEAKAAVIAQGQPMFAISNVEIDQNGLYSSAVEGAKRIRQEKGTYEQMRAQLIRNGAKEKELEATGIDKAYPDKQAKVTRSEIEDYLRNNKVELGRTVYGAPIDRDAASERMFGKPYIRLDSDQRAMVDHETHSGDYTAAKPRYASYSTPGGVEGSYREVVVTLPNSINAMEKSRREAAAAQFKPRLDEIRRELDTNWDGPNRIALLQEETDLLKQSWDAALAAVPDPSPYTSSHWPGITNPLIHYRLKDFEDGTRVLDELQSDWAQRARDQGTKDPAAFAQLQGELSEARKARDAAHQEAVDFIKNNPEFEQETGPIADIWSRKNGRAYEGVWLPEENPASDVASFLHEVYAAGGFPGGIGSKNEQAFILGNKIHNTQNVVNDLVSKENAAQKGAPNAPFISSTSDWVDLGLKQVLIDAAKDEGVKVLAWAPGQVQADRYGLENEIKELVYIPSSKTLIARRTDGRRGLQFDNVAQEGISEYVGAEMSKKLLDAPVSKDSMGEAHVLAGEGLRMGGEGMKSYYGDFNTDGSYNPGIVGTRLIKLVRALDPEAAKIGTTDIKGTVEGFSDPKYRHPTVGTYPSITITPKLRERILEGLPLFGNPSPVQVDPVKDQIAGAVEKAAKSSGVMFAISDQPFIDYEASRLTKDVRKFEDKLWDEGKDATAISEAISARYGFDVDPEDLVAKRVWWRLAEMKRGGEEADYDATINDTWAAGALQEWMADTETPVAVPTSLIEGGGQKQTAKSTNSWAKVTFARVGAKLTGEDTATIAELYATGMGAARIAGALSEAKGKYVRVSAVADVIEKSGLMKRGNDTTRRSAHMISVNKKSGKARWTDKAIAALKSKDVAAMSLKDIAMFLSDHYGMSLTPNAVKKARSKFEAAGKVGGKAKPARLGSSRGNYYIIQDGKRTYLNTRDQAEAEARLADFTKSAENDRVEPQVAPRLVLQKGKWAIQHAGGTLPLNLYEHQLTEARAALQNFTDRGVSSGPMFAISEEPEKTAEEWLNDYDARNAESQRGEVAGDSPANAEGRSTENSPDRSGAIGIESAPSYAGQELRDVRGAVGRSVQIPWDGALEQRVFYYYTQKSEARPSTTSPDPVALKFMRGTSHWVAKAHVMASGDGTWQVNAIRVRRNKRRQGIGASVLASMSRAIGSDLVPSARLSNTEFRFWQKADAPSVQYYQKIGASYYSADHLEDMRRVLDMVVKTSTDKKEIASAKKDQKAVYEALKAIAIDRSKAEPMFAISNDDVPGDIDAWLAQMEELQNDIRAPKSSRSGRNEQEADRGRQGNEAGRTARRSAPQRMDDIRPLSTFEGVGTDGLGRARANDWSVRTFDIGRDGYTGLTLRSENNADGNRMRAYYVFRNAVAPEPGGEGIDRQYQFETEGKWSNRVELIQRSGDRWEVMGVRTADGERGQGLARSAYEAIQRDLEIGMAPSGMLTNDGYAMWKAFNPASVQWHRPFNNMWISPKKAYQLKAMFSTMSESAVDFDELQGAFDANQRLNALIKALPAEALSPAAIEAMFAISDTANRDAVPETQASGGQGGTTKTGTASGTEGPNTPKGPKGISDIVRMLGDAAGLPIRVGRVTRVPGRSIKVSYASEGVGRIKTVDNIHQAAEAVAKHLQATSPGLEALQQTHAKELVGLAREVGGDDVASGFEQFLNRYISSFQGRYAYDKAPAFYDAFETYLDGVAPQMLADLQGTQQAYADYTKADATDRLQSDIVRPEPSTAYFEDVKARARSDIASLDPASGQRLGFVWATTKHLMSDFYRNFVSRNFAGHQFQKIALDLHERNTAMEGMSPVARVKARMAEMEMTPERLADLAYMPVDDVTGILNSSVPLAEEAMDKIGRALQRSRAWVAVGRDRISMKAGDDLFTHMKSAGNLRAWVENVISFGFQSRAPNVSGELQRLGPGYIEVMAAVMNGKAKNFEYDDAMLADFDSYLIARRAIESLYPKFKQGLIPNQPMRESEAAVKKILADMRAKHPHFDEAALQWDAFNKSWLAFAREWDLVSDEQYDQLITERAYAPFARDMTADDIQQARAAMSGGNSKKPLMFRLQGSDRNILSPTAVMLSRIQTVVQRSYQQGYAESISQLIDIAGPGIGIVAERVPATDIRVQQVNAMEAVRKAVKAAGLELDDVQVLLDAMADVAGNPDELQLNFMTQRPIMEKPGETLIPYREDGKLKFIAIYGTKANPHLAKDIFTTFAQAGQENFGPFMEVIRNLAQFRRATITSWPGFIMRNLIQDPIVHWGLYRWITVPGQTHVSGFKSWLSEDEFFKAYTSRVSGSGIMGGALTAEARRGINEQSIRGLVGGGTGMIETVRHFWDKFGQISEASETFGRLGLFKKAAQRAMAHGMTPLEAIQEAGKVATDVINYNEFGAIMGGIRSVSPFTGAGIAGTDKGLRVATGYSQHGFAIKNYFKKWGVYKDQKTAWNSLSDDERESVMDASALILKTVFAFGAVEMALWAMFHDDDDWRDQTDDVKDTHWVVPLGGFTRFIPKSWESFTEDQMSRIPKPFELSIPSNIIRMTMDSIAREQGGKKAAERMASSIRRSLTPPLSVPFLEEYWSLNANRDPMSGRQIIPDYLKSKDPEDQFGAYTSYLGKEVGEALKVSPMGVDFTIRTALGPWGRDLLTLSDRMDSERPAMSMSQTPLGVSRFVTSMGKGSVALDDYFEMKTPPMQMNVNHLTRIIGGQVQAFEPAKKRYHDAVDAGRLDQSRVELEQMDEQEKAYALLSEHWKGGGKTAETSATAHKRLHPLIRFDELRKVLSDVSRDTASNNLVQDTTNKEKQYGIKYPKAQMAPEQRRDVIRLMKHIQVMEAYNALVMMKHKGYQNLPVHPIAPFYAELAASAPEAYKEVSRRLDKAKILPVESVHAVWPDVQRIMANPELQNRISSSEVPEVKSVLIGVYAKAAGLARAAPKPDVPKARPPGMMRLGGPAMPVADPGVQVDDSSDLTNQPIGNTSLNADKNSPAYPEAYQAQSEMIH